MSAQDRRIIDLLRATRAVVLHPADHDRETLEGQLRRIGCEVHSAWPPPSELPLGADVVFLLVDPPGETNLPWMISESGPTIVAIIEYENPTVLHALIDSNAHGVVVKPLRPFGILSSLVLARSLHGYSRRIEKKVKKLEETMKARRDVEKAVKILADLRGVPEAQAYEIIRAQATRKRVSMSQVATALIGAQDVLKDSASD